MILKKAGLSELQNGTPDGIQTITGLRISAVDGTAFLDNCAELQKYTGRMIRIYDSGSRYLEGWIKENGVSETLVELFNDTGFDDATKWTILNTGWSIAGSAATATNVGLSSRVGQTINLGTTGNLIKMITVCDSISGGNFKFMLTSFASMVTTASVGTFTDYLLNPNVIIEAIRITPHNAVLNAVFSSFSASKVTTPSATGITIVSAQGGSTFNFTTKTTGFVYNATSYRYKIF